MVYHYTNFVIETNAWWLKKVRPVWWGATAIGIYFIIHRYYFYGKIQANMLQDTPKEEHEELAQLNKRQWGYGKYYKPAYETSLKKRLYAELGANYQYAEPWATRNMNDTRTLEQVYKEEDEEYDL